MGPPQCTMCSNASTWRCTVCNCSRYCSRECQKADWPIHKLLCNHLPNFSTPPNASTRRGIYFPAGNPTPQFVWVTTEWISQTDEYTPGFENIKHEPFIGDNTWDSIEIWDNVIRSRKRQDNIRLFMSETAVDDGSAPNRSIAELTVGVAFRPWCGSMLAMKAVTPAEDFGKYLHMDTVDFRDVVDLFRSDKSSVSISEMSLNREHKGPVSPLEEKLKQEAAAIDSAAASLLELCGSSLVHSQMKVGNTTAGDVPGVRINCMSDHFARGRPIYEAVKVPRNDPVWNAPALTIPYLIGMPVRVRRIRPASDNDEANQAATFLHVHTGPLDRYWGWAYPCEWQRPAGSVIVVHAHQRQSTSPTQVETLCSYCQNFLQPLFEESIENSLDTGLKNQILGCLNSTSYAEFCSGMTTIQSNEGPSRIFPLEPYTTE